MECSLAQVGSNTAWTLIVATIVIAVGAGTLIVSRRTAPAVALMVMVFGAIGVGAGSAEAGAPACEPVCFDVLDSPEAGEFPESIPDLLLESDDGVHVVATVFGSNDGTCTGDNEVVGTGAIADTEDEAEEICGGPATNLLAEGGALLDPAPAPNVWACTATL